MVIIIRYSDTIKLNLKYNSIKTSFNVNWISRFFMWMHSSIKIKIDYYVSKLSFQVMYKDWIQIVTNTKIQMSLNKAPVHCVIWIILWTLLEEKWFISLNALAILESLFCGKHIILVTEYITTGKKKYVVSGKEIKL